jgi:hypothetical protein
VIPDHDRPYEVVARLVDRLPSGSYLAVSHMAMDERTPEMFAVSARLHETMRDTNPPAFRPWTDIARFLTGLQLVYPGLVPVRRWRPDRTDASSERLRLGQVYGGIGRKR